MQDGRGGDTGAIGEAVTDEEIAAARAREDAYMAAIDQLPIDIVLKPKEARPKLPDPDPWGQWGPQSFIVPIDLAKLRLPGTRGYRTVGDTVYMDYEDGGHWEIPVNLPGPFYAHVDPISTSVKNAQIVDVYADGRVHKYPETPNWAGIEWKPDWWVDNDPDEVPVVYPFAGTSVDD